MRAADDEQELALRVAAALANYADPPENPAPRLLAARAIEEARIVGSRWWWSGAGLVSAMACLLVIALVAGLHHEPARRSIAAFAPAARATSRGQQPQLAQVNSTPVLTHSVKHVASQAKPPELPRLNQFPTPQPLTEQEKLMLAFVATATPATQRLVAHAVEPPLPFLDADLTGSSSPESTGAPHEEHR